MKNTNTATRWTVIKVGTYETTHNRVACKSSFHVQGVLSPCEAKAHALARINGDWCTIDSDYLRNCIALGNYTVEVR
jgi:hypothetical protein